MSRMARVWLFVVACLLSLAGKAQVQVISSQTINQYGQPLPNGLIRVCSATSTGVPCTPTVPIYQDYGLTIPAANPWTADQYGNFTFYVPALPPPNLYVIQESPDSGITWSYVFNGPYAGNAGYQYCTAYVGVDWVDQCNKAAAALNGNGGIVDATGYVGAVYSTTHMTATALPNTVLKLNPGAQYWFNQQFTTAQINASIASQTSGATGACIVPIGNQSAIISDGYNSLGGSTSLKLGPSASTYDFVCNAAQGVNTQETFRMDGVAMEGNITANLKGSILDIVGTYGPGSVNNSAIYYPFGPGLTMRSGGSFMFFNDMFDDTYPYAGGAPGATYGGALVNLACVFNVSFIGGQIGNNGLHNPQLVNQNCTTDTDLPTTGQGYNSADVQFIGVYFEPEPATVGSFSGAPANVDPIQLYDPVNFQFTQTTVGGLAGEPGTDQANWLDILSLSTGVGKGPVNFDGVVTGIYWSQNGKCLIDNQINTAYVAPSLRCKQAQENGPSYGIAGYHWAGSGATNFSSVDYRDSENVASAVDDKLQVPPLTFSSLPTCSSSTEGSVATISDGGSNLWGTGASGGGGYPASVLCDGIRWVVQGAYNTTTLQTLQADVLGGLGTFANGNANYGTGFTESGCNQDGGLNVCTYTRTNSTAPPGLTYSQQIQMTVNTDPSRGFNGIITTSGYNYTAGTNYLVNMWAKSDGTFSGQPSFDWTDFEGNSACSQISGTYLTTIWTYYAFSCTPTTTGNLPISFNVVPTLNSTGTYWIAGVAVAPIGPLTVGSLLSAITPYGIGPASTAQQSMVINGTTCILQQSCNVFSGTSGTFANPVSLTTANGIVTAVTAGSGANGTFAYPSSLTSVNGFVTSVTAGSAPPVTKTAIVTTGFCTTGTAAFSTCNFSMTWPTSFADTSYTPSCMAFVPTSGSSTATANIYIVSKSTSGMTLQLQNGDTTSAGATTLSELDCTGVHP